MLKDFFETNSVSLDVLETYDEFCLEKNGKTALNLTRRELYDEYKEERETEIIFLMTLYWCGLNKGVVDEKSHAKLKEITKEEIYDIYGEDALVVYASLEELLNAEPIKPIKKKADKSNPGSKNWSVGDLYAYKLSGESAKKIGHDGKYIILYCHNIRNVTRMTNHVTVYAFVGDEETPKASPEQIVCESLRVMSFTIKGYYQFLLASPHREYPTDKLIYLGNTDKFEHPDDERVPPEEIYTPFLVWPTFDDAVSHKIDVMLEKKYGVESRLKDQK